MYLCPLAVLLAFAIGVLVLSIVVPRLQERRQASDDFSYSAAAYEVATVDSQALGRDQEGYVPASGDAGFGSDESRMEENQVPEEISFDPLLDELVSSEHRDSE